MNDGPDVELELRAHRQRLQALGMVAPTDAELVLHNGQDGGVALWIPPGEFLMGSEDDAWPWLPRQGDKAAEEKPVPVHEVSVSGFYLDRYPVTNTQYEKFVRETGHRAPECGEWGGARWNMWQGQSLPWGHSRHPVVGVSWDDAEAYCQWAGRRLPTEAEWERAARGGLEGKRYPWGDELNPALASYARNVGSATSPAGIYPPNGYGLYDMAGNVWEWCSDRYAIDYYARSPRRDPTGTEEGENRLLRGGSWTHTPGQMQCAYRDRHPASDRGYVIGLRCARDAG
jgi:formylglycine-generating enzyme required for sulfatase activity